MLKKPGSNFSGNNWVDVISVANKDLVQFLQKDLDKGEAETIALAKQTKADIVIIDESAGYAIAKLLGLPVVRTLSILNLAKKKKIIQTIRPIVLEMVQNGRWYSRNVVEKFLSSVGE